MQRTDISLCVPVCAVYVGPRTFSTAAKHQQKSVHSVKCILFYNVDFKAAMMEWWSHENSWHQRHNEKFYGNTDFVHLAPTLSPFPFAFLQKISQSFLFPSHSPSLLFLLSSDAVAHPFPITLGCCLGPQHDPLYISTLLRLSIFVSVSLCCVCTFVHVREIENNSDHISATNLFFLLKSWDCESFELWYF